MSWNNRKDTFSFVTGSAIGQYVPAFIQVASSRDNTVLPCGSLNLDVLGFTVATQATYGYEVAVVVNGVSKGIAAASLGAGARVAVGSTNGRLVPAAVAGMSTAGGSALGAQGLRYSVGVALEAALDGEYFPVLIKPEQII